MKDQDPSAEGQRLKDSSHPPAMLGASAAPSRGLEVAFPRKICISTNL